MTRNRLALVFLVAVVIRLVFLLPVFLHPERAVSTVSDCYGYDMLARNLLWGHGFSRSPAQPYLPDGFRTPLYPVFVAFWYLLFGAHPLGIVLVQALLAGGIALLTAWLGYRLTENSQVGFVAGVLAGIGPNLVLASSLLLSETLFTFLFLLALLWVVLPPRPGHVVAAGFVAGLATLCRPVGLLLVFVFLVYLVASRRKLVVVLLFLLVYLTTITPWYVRNWTAFHRLTFATVAEANLGNYWAATMEAERQKISVSDAQTQIWDEAMSRLARRTPADTQNMAAAHGAVGEVGWERISHSPVRYARVHLEASALGLLLPVQFGTLNAYFAGPGSDLSTVAQEFLARLGQGRLTPAFALVFQRRVRASPGLALIIYLLSLLLHGFVFVAALLSFGQRKLGRGVIILFWVLVVYFVLASGPAGGPRLRAPADPLLSILAAAFLVKALPARR